MPEECSNTASSSAPTAVRASDGASRDQLRDVAERDRNDELEGVEQLAAFVDLSRAAERQERLCAGLGSECPQLGRSEHRRQRSGDRAAMKAGEQRHGGLDRVAPEEKHDVTGVDAARTEPGRQSDRGLTQIAVADAVLPDMQRDRVRLGDGAAGEFAPQIARSPMALCVVALGVRLKAQGRHPSLLVSIVMQWGRRRQPSHAKSGRGRARA